MSEMNRLPETAVVVITEVADWTTWKTQFDAHEGMRKAAGILGHHLNRGHENPNLVSIYMAVSDVAKAKAFMASADLRRVMAEAGVKGAPTAIWMKPVVADIVWDRELPALMVSHSVANFDTFLAAYTAGADLRKQGGIIGHAVNRSLDDPNLVTVYHQAETHDALKAFTASPGLKAAMEKAGVTSAPQFTFLTGGWAKNY